MITNGLTVELTLFDLEWPFKIIKSKGQINSFSFIVIILLYTAKTHPKTQNKITFFLTISSFNDFTEVLILGGVW